MHDFVIVGAGSAGCVLANRLTEDPAISVLLIEAGPSDDDENIHRPLGYVRLARSHYDWGYSSEPEPGCADRRIGLPRGKVLGGSSSVNAMIYMRGNRLDYEQWGLRGWSWADLLPYFLKAEDHHGAASPWHAEGGPLSVGPPRTVSPVTTAFLQAAEQAGLARNADFNGAEQDGAGLFELTQHDGMRASTADAYLHPALGRENLTLIDQAHVQRVLFEGTRAVGVSLLSGGREQQHRAAREVILSAGVYNSPQLLMLSGVGPAAHLREHGLPVLLDRAAVGANLSDHVASELLWSIEEPQERDRRRRWRSAAMLLAGRDGPFSAALAEAGAFARVGAGAPAPDVQFHCAPVYFAEDITELPEAQGLWLSPCLLTPESRGEVRLRSGEAHDAPVVRNGFYSAPGDLERMAAALRLALQISSRGALGEACAVPVSVPADEREETLREYLRESAYAFYHPVGTCRMGEDDHSVLDTSLRVRGLDALRVVDASVMPTVPRGNTNAPTIAIAELAADLIRHGAARQAPAAPAFMR